MQTLGVTNNDFELIITESPLVIHDIPLLKRDEHKNTIIGCVYRHSPIPTYFNKYEFEEELLNIDWTC